MRWTTATFVTDSPSELAGTLHDHFEGEEKFCERDYYIEVAEDHVGVKIQVFRGKSDRLILDDVRPAIGDADVVAVAHVDNTSCTADIGVYTVEDGEEQYETTYKVTVYGQTDAPPQLVARDEAETDISAAITEDIGVRPRLFW